jgi:hypothetical protein
MDTATNTPEDQSPDVAVLLLQLNEWLYQLGARYVGVGRWEHDQRPDLAVEIGYAYKELTVRVWGNDPRGPKNAKLLARLRVVNERSLADATNVIKHWSRQPASVHQDPMYKGMPKWS